MTNGEIIRSATCELIRMCRTMAHQCDPPHSGGCWRCNFEAYIVVIEDPQCAVAQMFVEGLALQSSPEWANASQSERMKMSLGLVAKKSGYTVENFKSTAVESTNSIGAAVQTEAKIQ